MAAENQDVTTDILFVGLTRPATVLGVPYLAFVAELMATAIIFLAFGNPLYLLCGVPLHGVLFLVSSHDPGVFLSIWVWLKTSGRCNRNARFWGSTSCSPVTTRKWFN